MRELLSGSIQLSPDRNVDSTNGLASSLVEVSERAAREVFDDLRQGKIPFLSGEKASLDTASSKDTAKHSTGSLIWGSVLAIGALGILARFPEAERVFSEAARLGPAELSLESRRLREVGTKLIKDLQDEGHIAVFAGGAVRDELMGLKPKDYDIATSATPEQMRELFARIGVNNFPKGAAHGVEAVEVNGDVFEIATLRKDGEYVDGRRPKSVEFVTSLREDAARRDLTINAMFIDPISGHIYDFFGGRNDIANKIIRAVGNPHTRIAEDRLRMLRAPRFAARFKDFIIDPELQDAIRKNAQFLNGDSARGLDPISAERIREELRTILVGPNPVHGIKLLDDLNLLQEVLPEIDALKGLEGAGWDHTLQVMDKLKGSSYEEMMGGLLYRSGMIERGMITGKGHIQDPELDLANVRVAGNVMDRLKHGNAERNAVLDIVRLQGTIRSVQDLSKADRGRLFDRPDIMRLINVHDADATVATAEGLPSLSQRPYVLAEMDLLRNAEHPAHRLGASPVVTGKQLTEWGYMPGPALGKMVQAARTEQYGHGISTLESARQFIDGRFNQFKGLSMNEQTKMLAQMGTPKTVAGSVSH